MMPNLEYLWDMAVHWVKVVFVIVPVSAWYSFFGFVALLKTVDKQEAFSRAFAEFKGKVAYAKEDDQRFVYENYVQSNMYQEGFGSDQETWFYTFLYCASVCSRHHWFDDQWLSLRVVSVCRANDVAIGFDDVLEVLSERKDLSKEFEFRLDELELNGNNTPK